MKKNVKRPVNEKQMYNSIMKEVSAVINKALNENSADMSDLEEDDELDEQELNELFGFGSSDVKKPEGTFALDNSDEENAKIIIEYCEYYLAKAGNNVAKGVAMLFENCGKWIVKAPMFLVTGLFKVISRTIKLAVMTPAAVAGVIAMGVAILIKMAKSGIENASEALKKLYNGLTQRIVAGYNKLKESGEKAMTTSSEALTMWLGMAAAAVRLAAEKVEGAAEAFGEWIKGVIKDAKDGVTVAILSLKSWLSTKVEAVVKYFNEMAENIRNTVVKAYNELDKAVRNGYNKVAETVEKWMDSLGDLAKQIGEKIADAASATKDFVIDKKDKALVWNIQKSIKGLSDKYKEEQVVALVRKCYNESVVPNMNGDFVINEAYFHERGTRVRRLYENHRRVLNKKRAVNG